MTSSALPRLARLEARIAPDIHAMLKRAAEIEGRSLTDFVVSAAAAAARLALESEHIIRLSRDDQKAFVESLISPNLLSVPAIERAKINHERLIAK
jgi:uncharacterized protein (DUF1778 family)